MDVQKLNEQEVAQKLAELEEGWEVQDDFINKEYEFENFVEALEFVNRVGALAEEADHHPDIFFGYGYAEIAITTHESGGLTERDFELAAKIDKL
jgi:4a-hydroxytetrahydrobiopterin dehydratase